MKKFFFSVAFTFLSITLNAQAIDVDVAIKETANSLEKQIPRGSSVIILNIESESITLSDYIIDELSIHYINNNNLIVVERNNIDVIQEELNFQMSGAVSDESAQSIGEMLGAQTIISGSIRPVGAYYQLTIRALAVETAVVQGLQRKNILFNKRLESLISGNTVIALSDMWKHKWLHLGVNLGGVMNMYNIQTIPYSSFQSDSFSDPDSSLQLTAGFSLSLQIASWLTLETGIQYIKEKTEVKPTSNGVIDFSSSTVSLSDPDSIINLSYSSIMFPVTVQFLYRPKGFSFSGLFGAFLSFPVSQMSFSGELQHMTWEGIFESKNPGFGLIFGGNIGYHLGPGIILLDLRYIMGFTKVKFEPADGYWDRPENYWIYMPSFEIKQNKLLFTLGYKIGLIDK